MKNSEQHADKILSAIDGTMDLDEVHRVVTGVVAAALTDHAQALAAEIAAAERARRGERE